MDKEKYEILLEELAEAIKKKNEKIDLQEHVIYTLTRHVESIENSMKQFKKSKHIEKRNH